MKRKRRNHSPAFKAKVALTALSGELTMAEMTKKFDLHAHQITAWKKQLLASASSAFEKGGGGPEDQEATIQALQAKIGQLTMENDFLESGLTKIHGPRGKKW